MAGFGAGAGAIAANSAKASAADNAKAMAAKVAMNANASKMAAANAAVKAAGTTSGSNVNALAAQQGAMKAAASDSSRALAGKMVSAAGGAARADRSAIRSGPSGGVGLPALPRQASSQVRSIDTLRGVLRQRRGPANPAAGLARQAALQGKRYSAQAQGALPQSIGREKKSQGFGE